MINRCTLGALVYGLAPSFLEVTSRRMTNCRTSSFLLKLKNFRMSRGEMGYIEMDVCVRESFSTTASPLLWPNALPFFLHPTLAPALHLASDAGPSCPSIPAPCIILLLLVHLSYGPLPSIDVIRYSRLARLGPNRFGWAESASVRPGISFSPCLVMMRWMAWMSAPTMQPRTDFLRRSPVRRCR